MYLCRAILVKKVHIGPAVAIGPWSYPLRREILLAQCPEAN
jgi:hypothetical protein